MKSNICEVIETNPNMISFAGNTIENRDIGETVFGGSFGGLGVRGILAEGDRLDRERQDLSAGTRALAFERYRAFIAASEAGKDVADQVTDAHVAAENVSTLLPSLREKCSKFESEASALSERRKRVSSVLAKHTRLLEILELPQLVETCVRNGHYEEALELRQFSAKVDRKLGSIPLVSSIVKAVQGSMKVMLQSLLAQLRTPIQLPACLRVVGYLRRMDIFTETELRLRFLQARDAWLTGVLASIVDGADPHQHISKTMDTTRVHLFDIVTQYRALFSDDDVMNVSNFSTSGGLTTTSSNLFQGSSSHRVLFSAWLDRRICLFLETLKTDLKRIVLASNQRSTGISPINYGGLDSLLNQAMYFGQSFGRIGADFRLSLVPIFRNTAIEMALGALEDADVKFSQGIEQLALKASVISSITQNRNFDHSSGIIESTLQNKTNLTQNKDDMNPPNSLLEYVPLAELCNTILIAFNEIRLVTPVSISPKLVSAIQVLLESAARTLSDRERRFAKNKTTTETELSAFGRIVDVFVHDLLGHIDKVTKSVFPPSLISNILAINSKDLMEGAKDNSNKCQVTINLASIIDLLPQKYITPASSHNYNDNMPKTGQIETNLQATTQETGTESIESTPIFVQEATPDSKVTNAKRLKDEAKHKEDETTKDVQSSYVVDRVDLIEKEIEESKISATE